MKPGDVPAEWMAAAEAVLMPGKPLNMGDLRRALAAVIPLIQAREREACAKVCDARYMGDNNREDMESRRCAAAIRARGEA